MKLSIKGLALASGILWGLAMLGMGLANMPYLLSAAFRLWASPSQLG